jgi:hypothetical protein
MAGSPGFPDIFVARWQRKPVERPVYDNRVITFPEKVCCNASQFQTDLPVFASASFHTVNPLWSPSQPV